MGMVEGIYIFLFIIFIIHAIHLLQQWQFLGCVANTEG